MHNAIDQQLKPWNNAQCLSAHNPSADFTEEWISHPVIPLHGLLSAHSKSTQNYAQTARGKRTPHHPRKHAQISQDDLLAQLSFGTWTSILPNPNRPRVSTPKTRIWEEAIVSAFPGVDQGDAGIRQIGEPLKKLYNLRNRVAHGEQLLEVNVQARFSDVLRALACIDQELADWCVDVSRVRAVQKLRPKVS